MSIHPIQITAKESVCTSPNETMGVLISLFPENACLPDADEFFYFMCEEFERNQCVYTVDDLIASSMGQFPVLQPLTPIILIKSKPRQFIQWLLSVGFAAKVIQEGDLYFSHISSLWYPSTIECVKSSEDVDNFMINILKKAVLWASETKKLIHIGLGLGWHMESHIGELDAFIEKDLNKSGRINWQRTPLG